MTTNDGVVESVNDVAVSGSVADRWNLVLLAEGYQHAELGTFAADATAFAAALWLHQPFNALQKEINIFRIDVSSTESGADTVGGPARATFFDAAFSTVTGLDRVLSVDWASVRNVALAHVPAADAELVLVNTTDFGGGADGPTAATTRHADGQLVALHELGHAAFGLEDEYAYLSQCGIHENRSSWPAGKPDPANPNVTLHPGLGTIPWAGLLSSPPPALPTTTNVDCTDCDVQHYPTLTNVVGAFEGAATYHCTVYRPQFNCRMRDHRIRFCAVCRGKITTTVRGATFP